MLTQGNHFSPINIVINGSPNVANPMSSGYKKNNGACNNLVYVSINALLSSCNLAKIG